MNIHNIFQTIIISLKILINHSQPKFINNTDSIECPAVNIIDANLIQNSNFNLKSL